VRDSSGSRLVAVVLLLKLGRVNAWYRGAEGRDDDDLKVQAAVTTMDS
jgi:hypothetical protein